MEVLGKEEEMMEEIEEEELEEEEEENLEEELQYMEEEVQDLEERFSAVEEQTPVIPEVSESLQIDVSQFPVSYKENSPEEQTLLRMVENFRKQYAYLYLDREPLFLSPLNECNLEKFVSTTVRPTLLPFSKLYSWDECAQFVATYLTMRPLHFPNELPSYLYSPTTTLRLQLGNCFDFSVLLCSLLLGAGYDAYCVSGYATKEMCLMDETREECPLLKKLVKVQEKTQKKVPKKYTVKPPRDLRSKFELQQSFKLERKIQLAKEDKLKEEEQRIAEAEKPKKDPLRGLRIHAWVLILSGKREVPENFFIDPFTAKSYSTADDLFLGIESLWNHKNYWINMQDCRYGCKDVTFDLGDPACWEFLLLDNDKPLLAIPETEEDDEADDETGEEKEEEEVEKIFHMPPSWVEQIQLLPKEFETQSPEGKKMTQYKRTKLETWAPYVKKDGLVSRLTIYESNEYFNVKEVKDWFKNRQDKLNMRRNKRKMLLTMEYFFEGRSDSLKAHMYKTLVPETERTMEFYSQARVDGLQKREETARQMIEIFEGRPDFLYYQHTVFGKRTKKVVIAGGINEPNLRPILKITERYHRNREKPVYEDVAERNFLILDERIQLTYHREDDRIIASKWEFLKPPITEKGTPVVLTPDMSIAYLVEPVEKFKKQLFVYEMLMGLLKAEQDAIARVRESEAEVLEILRVRAEEEQATELTISIYDTERNEKSKKQREEMELALQEERLRQAEQELDYLAPFLARMGNPEKLVKWQALQLKDDCLADFKQRLINQANIIQARFEKETQELQKKQQWYQQNQVSMTKEDEDTYLSYCSEVMFRIHILELRLNRHKELAPYKYLALEERLQNDSRLNQFLLL
ncbi:dynein regulatory complex subunit 7 [Rhinatrema bivittatum]|uniref:dynein regulatory complex subunit 7 n=1 Tax=Rhinatrema bivittatum TaxID=194408 RepID=UPI001127276B|nr:dynein regulatory complex subunit 7 [Rhinatrema bivittatum]XP_029464782.1 dynein regulatory complex subunit 7 [Rhinatrema bivittatum]